MPTTQSRQKTLVSGDSEAFSKLLSTTKKQVDALLVRAWDVKLKSLRPHGTPVVQMADAACELTLRGGKRFRAALLVAAYRAVSPKASHEHALVAGAALELLQTYLLIQDDWMDRDDIRRGGPSAHAMLRQSFEDKHLGDASAILASDLTFGFALQLLSSVSASEARKALVMRTFLDMHERIVLGQQLDLLGFEEDVEKVHELKTSSYTTEGPISLGAELAGATAALQRSLLRYSKPLGIAFQLRDDLLSAFGNPKDTGKAACKDILEGKWSSVNLEAKRQLKGTAATMFGNVFGRGSASAKELRDLQAALEHTRVRNRVAKRVIALCDEANEATRRLRISDQGKAWFRGAVRIIAEDPLVLGGGS